MNLKVEKNAGNKIMIKSYENDKGYESCRRVWKYNCCKKRKIYTFNRVDVCD